MTTRSQPSTPERRWPTYVAIAVLCLTVCAVWIGRIRLAPMPLDRDEGEYAYMGQLLLQGVPPYDQAFNGKLPGTNAAYAIVMGLFGQTPTGIHYGFLLINAITAVFVFLLARRLLDPLSGYFAAACFLVVSFAREIQGMSANAEHFVLLCVVPGLWLVLRYLEVDRLRELALSGLLLGMGVLMKQHGGAFVMVGAITVLGHELRRRPPGWRAFGRVGLLGAAILTPLLLTVAAIAAAGVFENFKFWVFDYARAYVAQVTWAEAWVQLQTASTQIFFGTTALWIVAGVGVAAVAFDPTVRRRRWFVGLCVAGSALAVCPGLFFRPQYFVFLLPVASVLFGLAAGAAVRRCRAAAAIAVILGFAAASLAITVVQQGTLWYRTDPDAASRRLFPGNLFVESRVFADYIREHSDPGARLAVIGSEPQIPFYARRRSATGHIYMYPLMQDQPYAGDMQRQAIADIEAAEPEYVVYALNSLSWLPSSNSSLEILRWFERYRIEHYRVVGIALSEVDPDNWEFLPSRHFWGEDAEKIAGSIWPTQRAVFEREALPVMILFKRWP